MICSLTFSQNQGADSVKIVFLSDTQEPTIFERVLLSYNNNAKARELILNKIASDSPRVVFHLGDLVASGLISSWEEIDTLVSMLKNQRAYFYPVPGNHEYIPFGDVSAASYFKRFGVLSGICYSTRINQLGVILINSNFDELSKKERDFLLNKYSKILSLYENDSNIKQIIVACHHSPFTNSKIVAPSKDVQKYLLPGFLKSKKSVLFLSGHSHAFEHFKMYGKDFFVIGGGGGIQHPLYLNEDAIYKDLFSKTEDKRMFHFIEITVKEKNVTINLNMLNENFDGFKTSTLLRFPN
ncbi:MAG: metallophosphoesterase [Ignavibacteria bacterium]|nr:MAG: metallophosphoesterase [Ignavibacteria bacterium]KAF0161394.1 MAG: metallophosphoesterase [Ignavibacteria bacterium]